MSFEYSDPVRARTRDPVDLLDDLDPPRRAPGPAPTVSEISHIVGRLTSRLDAIERARAAAVARQPAPARSAERLGTLLETLDDLDRKLSAIAAGRPPAAADRDRRPAASARPSDPPAAPRSPPPSRPAPAWTGRPAAEPPRATAWDEASPAADAPPRRPTMPPRRPLEPRPAALHRAPPEPRPTAAPASGRMPPRPPAADVDAAGIERLRRDIAHLRGEIRAVDPGPALKSLRDRQDEISSRLGRLAGTDGDAPALAELSERIDTLSRRIEALGSRDDLSAVERRLEQLSKTVAGAIAGARHDPGLAEAVAAAVRGELGAMRRELVEFARDHISAGSNEIAGAVSRLSGELRAQVRAIDASRSSGLEEIARRLSAIDERLAAAGARDGTPPTEVPSGADAARLERIERMVAGLDARLRPDGRPAAGEIDTHAADRTPRSTRFIAAARRAAGMGETADGPADAPPPIHASTHAPILSAPRAATTAAAPPRRHDWTRTFARVAPAAPVGDRIVPPPAVVAAAPPIPPRPAPPDAAAAPGGPAAAPVADLSAVRLAREEASPPPAAATPDVGLSQPAPAVRAGGPGRTAAAAIAAMRRPTDTRGAAMKRSLLLAVAVVVLLIGSYRFLNEPFRALVSEIEYVFGGNETRYASRDDDPTTTGSIPTRGGAAPFAMGDHPSAAAAVTGDAAATFASAIRLLDGKGAGGMGAGGDDTAAAGLMLRAAQGGLPQAQFRLGTLYERGTGVAADRAEAILWYERAAERGHVKAMHNLAVLVSDGADGTRDFARAAPWFVRAAEYGLADSQFNVAVLYARGLGVKQDLVAAYRWFAIAARGGDREAERRRGELASKIPPAVRAEADREIAAWRPAAADPSVNDDQQVVAGIAGGGRG